MNVYSFLNYYLSVPLLTLLLINSIFIIDKQIVRQEFLSYMKILEGLGLSVNIWDCERYGGLSFIKNPPPMMPLAIDPALTVPVIGSMNPNMNAPSMMMTTTHTGGDVTMNTITSTNISTHITTTHPNSIQRHAISWIHGGYEGKILIYPMLNQGDENNLLSEDLFQILRGVSWNSSIDSNPNANSTALPPSTLGAFIFIGNVDGSKFRSRLFKPVPSKPIPEQELREVFLISTPNERDLERKCNEYFEKVLHKVTPSRHYSSCALKFNPKKSGVFSKTSLGSAKYKELPVTATDCCFSLNTSSGNSQNFMVADSQNNLATNQFLVSSNFGRLLNTVIFSLPLERRLLLLKKPTEWLSQVKLVEENGEVSNYVKAILWSLYYNIYEEILFRDEIGRFTSIIKNDFENHVAEYQAHPERVKLSENLYLMLASLRKMLKWKGMLLSKTKENKRNFEQFADAMEKIIFTKLITDTTHVENLKKETKQKLKVLPETYFSFHMKFMQRLLMSHYQNELEKDLSSGLFGSVAKNFHSVSDGNSNFLDYW